MLRRLLDGWLRAAARSWPTEHRADLVREWRAELSALEAGPGRSAAVRTWQRVWFAGSLLLARRAGFDGVAGSVSHVDGPIWPTVVLFVTPILGVFPVVGPILTDIAAPSPVANVALATIATAASIGVGSVVGIVVGGRLAARSGAFSGVRAWLAVLVPVLCGVAVVGTTPAPHGWDPNPNPGAGIALAVVGAGLLGLFLAPAGALMSWAAARIRSRRGLGLVLVGLSGAVTLATIAATVWLDGDRPGWATGPGWWLGLLDRVQAGRYRPTTIPLDARPIELALLRLPGVVLVGATVVLAFTLRRSAAAPVPVATRPRPIAGAQPGPGRWWSSTLLLGAACCLVVWAVALTDVTPHVGGLKLIPSEILPPGLVDPWSGWSKEEGRVWTQDMQLGAIVAALLFFLCAAAYRALPLAPGLIAAAVLLVIDMVVVRLGLLRLWLLPWLIGTGLLLGLLAWRRAHRSPRTIDPGRGRSLVVSVSVIAAFLVPSIHAGWTSQGYQPSTPPGLVLVAVGLPTLLASLAAFGITVTTRRQLPGPLWTVPALVCAVTAGVAALRLYGPWPNEMVNGGSRVLIAWFGLATGPALAWLAYALITGRPHHLWALATTGFALTIFVGPAIVVPIWFGSAILGSTALAAMGYDHTMDGFPYIPGAVVIGLALGLLAHLAASRVGPAVTPDPARVT